MRITKYVLQETYQWMADIQDRSEFEMSQYFRRLRSAIFIIVSDLQNVTYVRMYC